jgi:fucose 4-O-acetylase-like acetyltransferase
MSFFFIRLGIIVAALGAAWLWEQRPTRGRWSPLQQLGRSSLFVYWIHVELVYGLISLPLHGAFSLAGAWTGFLLFAGLMVAVVVVKDHVTRKYLSKIDLREKLSRQVQALLF